MKRFLVALLICALCVGHLSAATTTTFMESGTDATQDFVFYASTAVNLTGVIATDTGRSNTGPRSIKFTQGAGNGTAIATSPNSVLADSGAQFAFAFNYDTAPGAINQIAIARTSGALNVFDLRLNTNGTGRVAPFGGTAVDGSVAMAVNTWYWIVASYYITNTTTFQIKMYIHSSTGALLDTITANGGTLTRTGTSQLVIGNATGNWANNSNIWIDDVYTATGGASSGSQPDLAGLIKITAKRPVSNGTLNDFTTQIGAGGSGYGSGHTPQVNEQPLSTTDGWSGGQAGTLKVEEYTIEGQSVGDVNVTGATFVDFSAWAYAKIDSAATGNLILKGSTTSITLSTSYQTFTAFASSAVYPAGNTDIGVSNASNNHLYSLAECGVLVAYTPAVVVTTLHNMTMTGSGQ